MVRDKKINISIVTGSRAEFGLLKKLIKKIHKDDAINLSLFVTGSHLSFIHGETINEIIDEGLKIDAKVDLKLKFDTPEGISDATSNGIKGFSKIFSKFKPDLLIILGDRYEIFSLDCVRNKFHCRLNNLNISIKLKRDQFSDTEPIIIFKKDKKLQMTINNTSKDDHTSYMYISTNNLKSLSLKMKGKNILSDDGGNVYRIQFFNNSEKETIFISH